MKKVIGIFLAMGWVKNPVGVGLTLFLVFVISVAMAQDAAPPTSCSLQKVWSHQFDKGEDVTRVAFGCDELGNPEKIVVALTRYIIGVPDSYYVNHPAWKRVIDIYSFPDGKKISEKVIEVKGEDSRGNSFVSPNGDIWTVSYHHNQKPFIDGYIERSNGAKTNLDLSQTSTCDQIDFSPTGDLALLSGGGWSLRDRNGTVLQFDANSDLLDSHQGNSQYSNTLFNLFVSLGKQI